jgi:replicative DNA helicase
MTAKLFSHTRHRMPVQAAIALVVALGIGTTALATELKSPASKSKLLRDKDVTIIIIDKDDDRSSSQTGASDRSDSSSLRQPATKIKRDDDVTIRIKRDSSNGDTIVRSGSKVIIVGKNTNGCTGDGVCIIRP